MTLVDEDAKNVRLYSKETMGKLYGEKVGLPRKILIYFRLDLAGYNIIDIAGIGMTAEGNPIDMNEDPFYTDRIPHEDRLRRRIQKVFENMFNGVRVEFW